MKLQMRIKTPSRLLAICAMLTIVVPAKSQNVSITAKSQNAILLIDSAELDKQTVYLEELKLISPNLVANKAIYKKIQSTYKVLNINNGTPEQRIKAKKTALLKCKAENNCAENQYGFEKYKIYYDKKYFINLSIGIQVYGSAYEGIKYYCFDLRSGENIGLKFFNNPQKLLKICKNKLDTDNNQEVTIQLTDLAGFQILTDKKGNISGVDFFAFDKNDSHDNLPKNILHFNWNEIKPYISIAYLN